MDLSQCARLEASGQPVMLKGVRASGDLRGLLLEMLIEQRFSNPSDKSIEVVYTFPLPWGAVLLGVEVQLGDKRLTGAVLEKNQAEAEYAEAICQGDAAIMLERNHDHSYSLNLGNLAPKEDCIVMVRHAQILQFEQRGLRLMVPTVIAPRFGDALGDGGLAPHQTPEHGRAAEYPFEIELRLHGDLALGRVASPSHPVSFARSAGAEGGELLTISLARKGYLDRDFVLVVDQLVHDSMAVLATDSVNPECVAALASFCPRVPAQGSSAIAVKILVDCSGSMQGDSIQAAKRSLEAIVRQLGAGDRFSLSCFGNEVRHRSRALWTATPATQAAAQRWVVDLQADMGGTEMESALRSTFALAQTVASDVLIVTDGEIYAIDSTIDAARASGHRLFVVGIGSSPAEIHLRRLAEATGGACDFVAPGEAVEPAVLRMFARLRSPRLFDLRMEWPSGIAPKWAAPLSASIFDGDTVNLFALLPWLPDAPLGDARLLGARMSGGALEEVARVHFGARVDVGDVVSKVVAIARVRTLGVEASETSRSSAGKLAVDYQLVTDQTNFLLVHRREESEKALDMPDLHKVIHMVPAGWSAGASYPESAQMTGGFLPPASAPPKPMQSAAPKKRVRSGAADLADLADLSMAGSPAPMPPVAPAPTAAGGVGAMFSRVADMLRGAASRSKDAPVIDRNNPLHWMRSEYCTGLTPFGLSELLRMTPPDALPTCYAQMHKIEVPLGVVDWLELSMAMRETMTYAEQIVVNSFLYLMSQSETNQALLNSSGLQEGFASIAQRLKQLFADESGVERPAIDVGFVEELMAALVEMKADAWPDGIFSMGA